MVTDCTFGAVVEVTMVRRGRRTTEAERTRAGAFLRERRIAAGVTQQEVSKALGIRWPTYVGQIEQGKGKVPAGRYADYARVLKMDPKDFVREMLKFYDFESWQILFGNKGGEDGTRCVQ